MFSRLITFSKQEEAEHDQSNISQAQPLPGKRMGRNSHGGYTFIVDDVTRFRRMLCLGGEDAKLRATNAEKLSLESCQALLNLLAQGRGLEVVAEIVDFSESGRCAKQDPLIFALAVCVRLGDLETKKAAFAVVSRVCRIPTTLFMFVEFCKNLTSTSGWGRAMRRTVSEWYLKKDPKQVAYLITKYQQRNGWCHRDLFRLCHLKPQAALHAALCSYVVHGWESVLNVEDNSGMMSLLRAVEDAKKATTANEIVTLIQEAGLVREHIPTQFLSSSAVWTALLQKMPLTALIRNLGKMSSIDLFSSENNVKLVLEKLSKEQNIRAARVHPLAILIALAQYSNGGGHKGKLKWTPNPLITSALDQAFYLAFKNVAPTNKRYLLAVDVSGSMCCPMKGTILSCRKGAAAMSMVTFKSERKCHLLAFSHTLVPIDIRRETSLDKVLSKMSQIPMGGTDCALPMLYAKEKRLPVDVFVVYTDSETWYGQVHPSVALKQYRKCMKIDARLIVVGMSSSNFSIADPEDAGMLDIAGFDANTPEIMSQFALGHI